MSLLNGVPINIRCMSMTFDVFHLDMSLLKDKRN